MHIKRAAFLDLNFDLLTLEDVKKRLDRVSAASRYAYVVTPNVDHVVRLHREPKFRELYDDADLCLCDSKVLRLLARMRGIRLPVVPGSDLAAALFAGVIKPGEQVAVVGGSSQSVKRLRRKFPDIGFLHHAPPMGLREDPAARRAAARFLAEANTRFSFLAVGSPQQEMIAREAREQEGAGGVALCIGAALEFLTGEQKRAPLLLRQAGLEWAHRLATNPRRLWRRYLVDGIRIFPIYVRWRGGTRWPLWLGMMLLFAGLGAAGIYAGRSLRTRSSLAQTTSPLPTAAQVAAEKAAVSGLPPPDLLKPLTPDEAAKENAERPFVSRADTPAARFVLRTDADDRDRALNCLTQAVYYEAASEGADGGRAVAQVVLNRMRHPGYPASVCGVVYQGAERPSGCQFTFTCDGSLLRAPVAALWARSRKIAEKALAGDVFAAVGHATHYHADYVLPYWADSLDKTVQIGRHIFYRLRGTLGDSRSFFQRYAGSEPLPPKPETDTAVVIPPAAVTDQLASALISDNVAGASTDVEKAAVPPAPAPLVDSLHGTLLADGEAAPVPSPRHKRTADCPASSQGKQLKPLTAEDVRAGVSNSGC